MFEKKYPIIGTDFAEAVEPKDLEKLLYMKQVESYGLTTAQIFYRMPDHKSILQSYLWQDYDQTPKFPALKNFLNFWEENLEGPLHSVRVTHRNLISPSEWRSARELKFN